MMTVIEQKEIELSQPQARLLPVDQYFSEITIFEGVRIEPYSPVAGGIVSGLKINAATEISDDLKQFLYNSLIKYGFLSFEPGIVSAEEFSHLIDVFGETNYLGTPYTPPANNDTRINTIDSKVKKTRMNFIWHIDQAFRPSPPRFTALFAVNAPQLGGDTVFASATAAYDLLDPLFAAYLDTLIAVHDIETQGFLTLAYQDKVELAKQKANTPSIEAPLIRINPETGRKQIFANELYTQRILGV